MAERKAEKIKIENNITNKTRMVEKTSTHLDNLKKELSKLTDDLQFHEDRLSDEILILNKSKAELTSLANQVTPNPASNSTAKVATKNISDEDDVDLQAAIIILESHENSQLPARNSTVTNNTHSNSSTNASTTSSIIATHTGTTKTSSSTHLNASHTVSTVGVNEETEHSDFDSDQEDDTEEEEIIYKPSPKHANKKSKLNNR